MDSLNVIINNNVFWKWTRRSRYDSVAFAYELESNAENVHMPRRHRVVSEVLKNRHRCNKHLSKWRFKEILRYNFSVKSALAVLACEHTLSLSLIVVSNYLCMNTPIVTIMCQNFARHQLCYTWFYRPKVFWPDNFWKIFNKQISIFLEFVQFWQLISWCQP